MLIHVDYLESQIQPCQEDLILKPFKAQLKEEMYTENKAMMKELLGEMTKLFREKQPEQSSDS